MVEVQTLYGSFHGAHVAKGSTNKGGLVHVYNVYRIDFLYNSGLFLPLEMRLLLIPLFSKFTSLITFPTVVTPNQAVVSHYR